MKNQAFTLIELLVVVLIIGILAAIAVTQYQKSIMKSRAAEAILNLKAIHEAQDIYKLANGARTTDISDLDINIQSDYYTYHCRSCEGACCYAILNNPSAHPSYPYAFEGRPSGTMYCRGTQEQCKTFSKTQVNMGSGDYWLMENGIL